MLHFLFFFKTLVFWHVNLPQISLDYWCIYSVVNFKILTTFALTIERNCPHLIPVLWQTPSVLFCFCLHFWLFATSLPSNTMKCSLLICISNISLRVSRFFKKLVGCIWGEGSVRNQGLSNSFAIGGPSFFVPVLRLPFLKLLMSAVLPSLLQWHGFMCVWRACILLSGCIISQDPLTWAHYLFEICISHLTR